MIEWIKNRLSERTSLDGGALIAIGVIALMFDGLLTWAAYNPGYGAWTLLKSE